MTEILTTKVEVIAALKALNERELMIIAVAVAYGYAIGTPNFPSDIGLVERGALTPLVKSVVTSNVIQVGSSYHVVD